MGTYLQELERKLCTASQNRRFSPEYSFSKNFVNHSRPDVSLRSSSKDSAHLLTRLELISDLKNKAHGTKQLESCMSLTLYPSPKNPLDLIAMD